MILSGKFENLRRSAEKDLTLTGLKMLIVVWSIIVIILALSINNKWILASILAYEVLP